MYREHIHFQRLYLSMPYKRFLTVFIFFIPVIELIVFLHISNQLVLSQQILPLSLKSKSRLSGSKEHKLLLTKRLKRQFQSKSEDDSLLKSKLLANLNKYYSNMNGDMLAPIASSDDSKLLQITTVAPLFDIFKSINDNFSPPSKEIPNLFGNIFLDTSLKPSLIPDLKFPFFSPSLLPISSTVLPISFAPQKTAPFSPTNSSLTLFQTFNKYPAATLKKKFSNTQLPISSLFVPYKTSDTFDVLYQNSNALNAANENRPSLETFYDNDTFAKSNKIDEIKLECNQTPRGYPMYINQTTKTTVDLNNTSLCDNDINSSRQQPLKTPVKNLRMWRQQWYKNLLFLHISTTTVMTTTTTGKEPFLFSKMEKPLNNMRILSNNPFSKNNNYKKVGDPTNQKMFEQRRQLITLSENEANNNYLTLLNNIAKRPKPEVLKGLIYNNEQFSRLLEIKNKFRKNTFIDNLFSTQIPIQVASQAENEFSEDDTSSQAIQISSLPVTRITLPTYSRNQREYSRHRNLGALQTPSSLPIIIKPSPFNSQLDSLNSLPLNQPEQKTKKNFTSLFPKQQQQNQPNIPLLSEYATTTQLPLLFFLTTTQQSVTDPPELFVKELEELGDDYDAKDDITLQTNKVAEPHGNMLCSSSEPKGSLNYVETPLTQPASTFDQTTGQAFEGEENFGSEENTDVCNSQRLNQIIKKAAIPGNVEASKRAIQQRAEAELGTFYNVICGSGFFSYTAHTDEFCLVSAGDFNCYIFSPVSNVRLGSGISRKRHILHHRDTKSKNKKHLAKALSISDRNKMLFDARKNDANTDFASKMSKN